MKVFWLILLCPLLVFAKWEFELEGFTFSVPVVDSQTLHEYFTYLEDLPSAEPVLSFSTVELNGQDYYLFNLPARYQQSPYKEQLANQLLENYSRVVRYYQRQDPAISDFLRGFLQHLTDFKRKQNEAEQLRNRYNGIPNSKREADMLGKAILYVQFKGRLQHSASRQFPYTDTAIRPNPTHGEVDLNGDDPQAFYNAFLEHYPKGSLRYLEGIRSSDNVYNRILTYSHQTPPSGILEFLTRNQRNDLKRYLLLIQQTQNLSRILEEQTRAFYKIIEDKHHQRRFNDVALLSPIYLYVFPSSAHQETLAILEYYRRASHVEKHILDLIQTYDPLRPKQEVLLEIYYLLVNNTPTPQIVEKVSAFYSH